MNFHAFFFVFVLQGKMQGLHMSKHENKKYVERIYVMMQWLMQNVMLEYDNEQM